MSITLSNIEPEVSTVEIWGNLTLYPIKESGDFWAIIDELCDDKSPFLCNRKCILDALLKGNLYGLQVDETDETYGRTHKIFMEGSYRLLPCFCIKENDIAMIIWTHTRARRLGFARKLLELLNIKYAWRPLPDSLEFWHKMKIGEPHHLEK